ncbi:MAG: hypothetical protein ACREIT_07070 [Tepidisphaeraceae bacterium]
MRNAGSKPRPARAAWLIVFYSAFRILPVAFLPGCVAAGAIAYKVVGPPAVEARHVLAKEPTLVMVENYRQPSGSATDAEVLGRHVVVELMKHDLAPTVDVNTLYDLRQRDPKAFRTMSIDAVGRKLGAGQIVYIDLTQCAIEGTLGGDMVKGVMSARVRVVDVETGKTLWPEEGGDGFPLSAGIPFTPVGQGTDESSIRQRLCASMADQIGKLFRKWKPDDLDDHSKGSEGV